LLKQQLQFHRPAGVAHRRDLAIDAGVDVVVKVLGTNDESDFIADLRQQEQAAEHRPLGLDAARRLAVEQFAESLASNNAGFLVDRGHVNSIRQKSK
jgi:hypothetical protein